MDKGEIHLSVGRIEPWYGGSKRREKRECPNSSCQGGRRCGGRSYVGRLYMAVVAHGSATYILLFSFLNFLQHSFSSHNGTRVRGMPAATDVRPTTGGKRCIRRAAAGMLQRTARLLIT